MNARYFADISTIGETNAPLNFATYRKAGALTVMMKATEGTGFQDPHHHDWCHRAHGAGLSVIHYHFARPQQSAQKQAQYFWSFVRHYVGPFDYVVLDYEVAGVNGSADAAFVRTFAAEISKLSRYRSILYSYRAFLAERAGVNWGPIRVHEADYSTARDWVPRGTSFFARQFTDGQSGPLPHTLPGVGMPCDVNRLNWKTVAWLAANRFRNHHGK